MYVCVNSSNCVVMFLNIIHYYLYVTANVCYIALYLLLM